MYVDETWVQGIVEWNYCRNRGLGWVVKGLVWVRVVQGRWSMCRVRTIVLWQNSPSVHERPWSVFRETLPRDKKALSSWTPEKQISGPLPCHKTVPHYMNARTAVPFGTTSRWSKTLPLVMSSVVVAPQEESNRARCCQMWTCWFLLFRPEILLFHSTHVDSCLRIFCRVACTYLSCGRTRAETRRLHFPLLPVWITSFACLCVMVIPAHPVCPMSLLVGSDRLFSKSAFDGVAAGPTNCGRISSPSGRRHRILRATVMVATFRVWSIWVWDFLLF